MSVSEILIDDVAEPGDTGERVNDFDVPQGRHICVVTETYAPEINGVALTLGRLVEGLRARGHRVSLVRPRQARGDQAGRGSDPDVITVAGVPLPGYNGVRA